MSAVVIGRWLFALCLLASWYNHLRNILTADRIAYDRRRAFGLRDAAKTTRLVALGATLPFASCLVAFALRMFEPWTGILIVGALYALRRVAVAQWPDDQVVRLGKYVPSAAALVGYSVMSVALRFSSWDAPRREALAWEAAAGVLAAAYGLSAYAKHEQSGWRWGRSDNVALLVAERAYGGAPSLFRFRLWAAQSPRVCAVLGYTSVFIEAAGVLFVVSALRWPYTALATSLQLGIVVLLGYLEVEWILVMIAVTLVST